MRGCKTLFNRSVAGAEYINKMKCPKCNKTLNSLLNKQSGIMWYIMDSEGNYEQDDDPFDEDGVINVWIHQHPECMQVVANTEEEALKLLKQ